MPSPTTLLIKDELWGFAKSKVMLVLWVVLPALGVLGYFILPSQLKSGMGRMLSASSFMALIESSIAGTVAALMVAVDIVSEKNRKVYDLYVIRPIPRRAIILAKFVAVFTCVAIACLVSMCAGIAVDLIRGQEITDLYEIAKAFTSLVGVIALSAAVGVFFGVVSKTILVAVILVLYVGQNLAIVPMLPMYFGILPSSFWMFIAISAALVALVLWGSVALFKRNEL
jgi:ABC-2 type transport system permease protein